jgi:hypothetical protein
MTAGISGSSAALGYSSRVLPRELILVVFGSSSEGLAAPSEELVRSSVEVLDDESEVFPDGEGASEGGGM